MINLDSRLINALNGDELAIFCHILKRMNPLTKEAFPSRETLRKETGFGRGKIAVGLTTLCDKGIISRKQHKEEGRFSKTIYTIISPMAGVYINAKGYQMENKYTYKDYRNTESGITEKTVAQDEPLSINQNISINQEKGVPPSLETLKATSKKEKTPPPPIENPPSKKVPFHKSKWNNIDTVRTYLLKNPKYVEKYNGVDLQHYIDEVLSWSDKSGKLTTDRGWIAYIRDFMNDDVEAGKLYKKKRQAKRQADLTVEELAEQRKDGTHRNF